VEDNLYTPHRHPGYPRLPQVGLDELHSALGEMLLDILQFAAGRSSTMRTFAPRSTKASVRWEPMKEAPPVIKMRQFCQVTMIILLETKDIFKIQSTAPPINVHFHWRLHCVNQPEGKELPHN
jgi:hypothetical protein